MPAALREFGSADGAAASVSRMSAIDASSFSLNDSAGSRAFSPSVQRRARTPQPSMGGSAPRARSATGYTSRVLDARGVARQVDVFESLVERGKISAEAKDRARVEAEREKLRRCRSVPKINRLVDDHMAPSTTSIFQRLWNKDQEKKQRHHTKVLIMQKKEEELFATLFQPRISGKGHRSKGTTGTATSTEKYSFKTQQRMEEIRKEKIMREMETMMDAPDINPKSKLMAQRQRERDGLAGYSHIEAMLERDRLNKLARYEQRERELISQNPGTPRITEYAASLHRGDESANERLYRAAQQRSRTPTARDGGLNASIYATPSRTGGGGGGGEFASLAQHEAEARARRDERARRIIESEALTHTPAINPVSASIAARLPTTTEERLAAATPRRSSTRLTSGSAQSLGSVEPTTAADSAAPPSARDVQLFERLRVAEARRRMRIDAARAEMEQRRDEECTFAPVTTTSYYPPSRPSTTDAKGVPDLYSRSQQWQQSRDERLRQQKEAREEAEANAFSHQPAISRKTLEIYEKGSYDDAVGPFTESVSGFDAFVSRQQRAKAATADDDADAYRAVSSKPWNGSTVLESADASSMSAIPSRRAEAEEARPTPSRPHGGISTSIYDRR